jgi:methylmalonyl-CoA/ethylmalonyl-CoA epimerase
MKDPVRLDRIGQISITVKDVDRATAFYRDVLGLKFLFAFPGMAFFDCGGVRLYLTVAESPAFAHSSILYYRVDVIEDAAQTLRERGVVFEREPHRLHGDARQELWMAFFKDSEENTLALMCERPPAEAS